MPTINQLPTLDTLEPSNQVPTYSVENGDARKFSLSTLTAYMQDNLALPDNAANITYDPAGTGAVSRTVQSKLRDVVSVKDFGAVGDGVADDTAAIQAAVNAAVAASGAAILFPSGNYKITNEILLGSNVEIIGHEGSIINQVTNGKRALVGVDVQNVKITGLTFNGVGSSVPFTSNYGLLDISGTTSGGSKRVFVSSCKVFDAYTGISCTNVDGLWIQDNIVQRFFLYGVLASASANFHIDANNISDCTSTGTQNSYGIQATGSASNPQKQCSISNNAIVNVPTWDGIMSHGTDDLLISGNKIVNVRTGIDVSAVNPVNNILISGNFIKLTTTNTHGATPGLSAGVFVSGIIATSTNFSGCVITSNIITGYNNISGAAFAGSLYGAISIQNVDDCIISDNVIEDFGNAVAGAVGIASYLTIRNLTISGNSMSGTMDSYGVRVQINAGDVASQIVISNNSVYTNGTGLAHTFFVNGTFNEVVCAGNSTNISEKNYLVSSSTVNCADGYGIFTPSLQFGGASTGITYTQQVGWYHRQQNVVFFEIAIILSAKGSSTGNASIAGLPFAVGSTPALHGHSANFLSLASITGQVTASAVLSQVDLFQISSSGYVFLTDANFTNTSRISIQGFYRL